MSLEQKQFELQRHQAIIMATLDYLNNILEQSVAPDQLEFIKEAYIQQRVQAKKYFEQRRLDRLKKQLESLTRAIQMRCDLDFGRHIKLETGYDIDVFEMLRNRVDKIFARKEVYKKSEHNDINALARYYRQVIYNEGADEKLKALLLNYSKMDTSKTPIRKKDSSTVSRNLK